MAKTAKAATATKDIAASIIGVDVIKTLETAKEQGKQVRAAVEQLAKATANITVNGSPLQALSYNDLLAAVGNVARQEENRTAAQELVGDLFEVSPVQANRNEPTGDKLMTVLKLELVHRELMNNTEGDDLSVAIAMIERISNS